MRWRRVVGVRGHTYSYGRRILNCHSKDSLWKCTIATRTTQSFSSRHRTADDKRRPNVALYVILGSRKCFFLLLVLVTSTQHDNRVCMIKKAKVSHELS
jgi:hypothetical protein